jgi:AcrR family transcriptional regulator
MRKLPFAPQSDLCDTVAHNKPELRASSAKDARAVRSVTALREALLTLLERKPFDQITIREICAVAGLHYATFFRHHPSKEALLDAVAADQIDTIVGLALARDGGVGHEGWRTLCLYVDEHRALWAALLNGGAAAAMREEWLRNAQRVAAQREPASTWLPMELGIVCSVSLIADTLSWWLAQSAEAHSVDEVAAMLDRLVTTSTMSD